jgi:predicted RNase H-like HicB family nuclease
MSNVRPKLHCQDDGLIIIATLVAERCLVKTYSAVIERDSQTGLFVGFVPGFAGAHSQGATLDELHENLREVISMLLEDGEPELESEFIGVQNVAIA